MAVTLDEELFAIGGQVFIPVDEQVDKIIQPPESRTVKPKRRM